MMFRCYSSIHLLVQNLLLDFVFLLLFVKYLIDFFFSNLFIIIINSNDAFGSNKWWNIILKIAAACSLRFPLFRKHKYNTFLFATKTFSCIFGAVITFPEMRGLFLCHWFACFLREHFESTLFMKWSLAISLTVPRARILSCFRH